MKFELPKLPYKLDALEPFISKTTLEYHYGKHHNAYVNNLNKLIEGTVFADQGLEDIVKGSEGGIFNNAAQVWNHTFYFMQFDKNGSKEPTGKLAELIVDSFGSFEAFKEKFSKTAATLFGSGWAWLVLTRDDKLEIEQTTNAATPLTEHPIPLMTCDVWEHAYYLDKQNARPAYIADFWEILDWSVVESRLP